MIRIAKVWAAAHGRHFVLPDDIKTLARPVWQHRLLLDAEAEFAGTSSQTVIVARARRDRRSAGANGGLMAAEALSAPSAQTDRDAGWRDVAAVIGARVLTRLRIIGAAIRPLAWVLMAIAVGFWILGQIAGWWEFTVAAIVIAITVALCALFLIGRTAYDVSLDLARTRVVVGERAVGALTLANRGSRAILPSRIVLPVGSGRGEFGIQRLAPGEEAEELFAIPTQKRGVVKVGPVSVVRGDPLGLFERAHRRDDPVDLFVHPRTVLFDGQSLGYLRDLEGLPAADLSRDDVSFHALLEYQPGDDLRHVHWRSTARTGTMMVRQYEETRRSHFVIGLSRSSGDYATADDFELAISAAGLHRPARAARLAARRHARAGARAARRHRQAAARFALRRREQQAARRRHRRARRRRARPRCRSRASWCSCAGRKCDPTTCASRARGFRSARARSPSSPTRRRRPRLCAASATPT